MDTYTTAVCSEDTMLRSFFVPVLFLGSLGELFGNIAVSEYKNALRTNHICKKMSLSHPMVGEASDSSGSRGACTGTVVSIELIFISRTVSTSFFRQYFDVCCAHSNIAIGTIFEKVMLTRIPFEEQRRLNSLRT